MGCGGKKKVMKADDLYIDEEIDCPGCEDCEEVTVDIFKANSEQQMVFGWANVALQADGTVPLDWEGDITSPAVLEKAAYKFVLKYRNTGEMHESEVVGQLIESCMFTKEKMAAIGIPEGIIPEGWWVGVYIPDPEVCEKIKNGQYRMFSVQGKIKRLKI